MDIGSILVGGALGGLISWWVTGVYYRKSSQVMESTLKSEIRKLRNSDSLFEFEKALESSAWTKDVIDDKCLWTSESNHKFQIDTSDSGTDFYEAWTRHFPHNVGRKFELLLKINGNPIKKLYFIDIDGGRYTLPLPELILVDEEPVYFWRTNHISYKIAKVIGNFYRYKALEQVAAFTKVEMVNEGRNS